MDTLNTEINDALIIAYLNGENLPDEQNEYITQWLQEPANKSIAEDAYSAWELSMLAADVPDDIDVQWEKIDGIIDKRDLRESQSYTRWWWSAAAVLLIAGGTYMGFFLYSTPSTSVTHLKPEKAKQEYVLPDETRVVLDENAELFYADNQLSHSSDQRVITLTGSAYFDVSPDKQKPFIIKRADAEVQVLGTKFYISSNEVGGTIVSVVEGSVSVNYLDSNKSFILNPNEQIGANQDEVSAMVINNFFWNTGKLSFQNDPLMDVFHQLGEIYGISFELEKESVGNCLLTSQFEDLDLQEVLKILSSIYQIEFHQTGNKLTVSGGGCQ